MSYACAYKRTRLILIHASAKTVPGFLINSPPWITFSEDVRNAELGEAVRTALAAYREGVPAPDYGSADWKALRRARCRAAGVNSERAYMTESAYVSLCAENGSLRLTPSRNGGTRGDAKGFHFLPEFALRTQADPDSDAIGRAVREALDLCT
jgi:hypothetical protein